MAFENLPRSTTRLGYATVRDHQRCCVLSREERGLPLHPANDFIACPDCDGTGEHVRNDSAIGDPQCEYGVACGRCNGEGEIADGLIDPLLLVAKYRKGRFSWAMGQRRAADRRYHYNLCRMRAMRHCAGLDQVDMLFQLHQCGNELERSIASWKAVAA